LLFSTATKIKIYKKSKELNMKKDIFARLSRGESVPFTDTEYCKIHKAVEQTKKLSVKLNNTYDPDEIIRVLWERFISILEREIQK
jgi:hypothetical protein